MNSRKSIVAAFAVLFAAIPLYAEPLNDKRPSRAESADNPDLYKAYFLEHACRDFAGARKLYQAAATGDALTQRAAKAGANRCRDHLAAQNFATLMPPEALA